MFCFFKLHSCIHLFIHSLYVYVHACEHVCCHVHGYQRITLGSLLLCGSPESNSGYWHWWQMPLPTELSCQPLSVFKKIHLLLCACTWCVCMDTGAPECLEVRRQLDEVISLVPPFCGFQRLILGCQVCVKRVFTHWIISMVLQYFQILFPFLSKFGT